MTETTLGYKIQADPQGRWIEAWSAWHLPFMNLSAEQRRYRHEVGTAIKELTSSGVIHATYTSPHTSRAPDTENVLFYNVGPARFSRVATDVLRFERRFEAPPVPPMSLGFEARHYVRYETGARTSPRRYRRSGQGGSAEARFLRRPRPPRANAAARVSAS
jgi:hypothetical protein